MSEVSILHEDADSFDCKKFNLTEHIKHVFGMYSGELIRAVLTFDDSLVNVVLDHFGKDVKLKPIEDGWFKAEVNVSVSPVFLAWMFQFGERAEIKEPEILIAAMRELIKANMRKYIPESEGRKNP